MSYQLSPDPRLEFSPVCRGLIFANVAVFALGLVGQFLSIKALQTNSLLTTFGLFPHTLFRDGLLWTPFTYMFLHANLIHIGVNMMGLYLLGPDLEQALGHLRFLTFYIISGIIGALGFLVISFLLQGQTLPVVGASGAIFGLLGGVVALYPSRVYVILPLMIPMKASILAVLLLTSHIFFIVTPYGSNVAYDVHLAGGLAGFFMAGGAALLHRKRYQHIIPAPEVPYAKVELETLAYRLAEEAEVEDADHSRYHRLREILRFEDIPSVEELKASRPSKTD
jgi:membrane associated rhomboid family serine protease